MLAAAQAAAEDATAVLRRLRLAADLDRGIVELRRDPVRVDDIVRGLLPILESLGERREVRVVADLAPALPRVPADRTYLNETLSLLLRDAVERTGNKGEVRISVELVPGAVRLTATHGPGEAGLLAVALVRQLSRAMGITITETSQSTVVEMPLASA